MDTTMAGTMRVPGASLYYEVIGSGPLLLMIPPGGGDADSFHAVADHLARHYTVVSYDRRGYSRSPLDNPTEDQRIETQGDDACYLLATLSSEPADVFGSSGGALIGLDLVTRHPEQVRALVAHEPPLQHLLPNTERPMAAEDMYEIYRREGAASALQKFAARIGVKDDDREPNIDLAQQRRAAANAEFFFAREVAARIWSRYTLDIDALLATPTLIVPAGGRTGREYVGYRCAAALAQRLGTTLTEFPSHHAGFLTHPQEFAETLHQILALTPEPSNHTNHRKSCREPIGNETSPSKREL